MSGNEHVRWKLLAMHAKRRWRRQVPFDLCQYIKPVAHVQGIVIGLDLLDRGRSLGESQLERMEGLVQDLSALVGHDGVAHRLGGENEAHPDCCQCQSARFVQVLISAQCGFDAVVCIG